MTKKSSELFVMQSKEDSHETMSLPACGMYFGSGVYHSEKNYLILSGRAFTTWCSQVLSPLEILDLVIADNQGNLVQLWGLDSGAWKGGKLSSAIMAEYHDLEAIGEIPPKPDWRSRTSLKWEEWSMADRFSSRYGAGLIKFIDKATQLGLYTLLIYTDAAPEWSSKLPNCGSKYLGYDYGERFSLGLGGNHLEAPTLDRVASKFIESVREHVLQRKNSGWGRIFSTCADFHIDYEILAGTDVPLVEDFAFKHLNFSSSLARGLYRQHNLPLWGSHMAHEHFSFIPYSNPLKFPLLRAAFEQKYLSGCKILINESGNWALQSVLCEDSPMHLLPSVESSNIHDRDPMRAAEYVAEAEKLYHHVDYSSKTATQYRRVISEFYDFLKTEGTPQGQPEVTLAVAKGNFDLAGQEFDFNHAIGGLSDHAETDLAWYEGAPERSWELIRSTFYPRPEILGEHRNLFLSGTPYGLIDIVSFALDQIQTDFLSRHYKALLFSGWNTASELQYEILEKYVRMGGVLFLAIPHLSTRLDRNYISYTVDDLIRKGNFDSLCGVRVKGKGRRFYWATSFSHEDLLGWQFPRRFGTMGTALGELEIVDSAVETVIVEDEKLHPLLLRRKLGSGWVYFLNSWVYPGALTNNFGPGSALGQKNLMESIYALIARQVRGAVWITSDGSNGDKDCSYIAYSYFPESEKICLQNIDFQSIRSVILHVRDKQLKIHLNPGEFRLLSALEV